MSPSLPLLTATRLNLIFNNSITNYFPRRPEGTSPWPYQKHAS
ncbi:MAG: hypothetical protein WCU83_09690 [Bacteroidia bacterium]